MSNLRNLCVLCAAFLLPAGPALAQDEVEEIEAETVTEAEAEAPIAGPREVRLLTFDGGQRFLTTSARLRIWRPEVGYQMEVDATGKPTSCKITQKFRRTYVNKKLCEVLMEHHTFEPALNAESEPVAGTYQHTINYLELRAEG